MQNRRKFILQGSLTAAALMAARSVKAVEHCTRHLDLAGFHYNSITFLHTQSRHPALVPRLKKAAGSSAPVVLHHTTNQEEYTNLPFRCDASHGSVRDMPGRPYRLIEKDNIRIGVIAAVAGKEQESERVNNLARFLKQEKNCQLVVCLSELGFSRPHSLDDRQLALESENLDIIIGKKEKASPRQPFIARNKHKAEVIIQHNDDTDQALSRIRIGFDPAGRKYHVSF